MSTISLVWAASVRSLWVQMPLLMAFLSGVLIFGSDQGRSLIERTVASQDQATALSLIAFFSCALVALISIITQLAAYRAWAQSDPSRCQTTTFKTTAEIAPSIVIALWLWLLHWSFNDLWQMNMLVVVGALLVISNVIWHMRGFASAHRIGAVAAHGQPFRQVRRCLLLLLILLCILPSIYCGWATNTDVDQLERLGPIGILIVGIVSMAGLTSVVLVTIPALLGDTRYALVPITLVLLNVLTTSPQYVGSSAAPADMTIPKESLAQATLSKNPPTSVYKAAGIEDPLHTDLNRPPEAWLISAEGGGIRAAYWTAMVLAQINEQLDGKLGKRITILSGVSGGSLGTATWLAADQLTNLTPAQKTNAVDHFLSGDLLSPLLAGLLFVDAPKLLLGPLWWRQSRDTVFERTLIARWQRQTGSNFFARPMLRTGICESDCPQPVVIFNTTEVTSGLLVPLSNAPGWLHSGLPHWGSRRMHAVESDLEVSTLMDAPIASLVHMSARFPFLSPVGTIGFYRDRLLAKRRNDALFLAEADLGLPLEEVEKKQAEAQFLFSEKMITGMPDIFEGGRLVDGGYVDNSGLIIELEILKTIALHLSEARREICRDENNPICKWLKNYQIHLIHIGNNPELVSTGTPTITNAPRTLLDFISGPIEALLSSREARSALTKSSLSREAGDQRGVKTRVTWIELSRELETLGDEKFDSQQQVRNAASELDMRRAKIRSDYENGFIDHSEMETTLAEKTRYYTKLIDYRRKMACLNTLHDTAILHNPPLGWVLGPLDLDLLRCMSAQVARRSDLPLPESP